MNPAHDPITETIGIIIAATFILGLLAEFIISRLLKKNIFSAEFLTINLSIASLQQLTDVFSKIIFVSAFIFVQQHYSIQKLFGWQAVQLLNPFSAAAGFPFFTIHPAILLNYIFVLVIADFCQYWLHRASHEVNIMWAGHITHHSNTEYNYGVALRQNALENIYTWVFFMPLAFLGIPWQMFVAAYGVSLLWQFFVHTRLVNKMGVLELFMSTPSHHRVHHGKNKQYIDKNYGAFFIIWDKWFGTFEPEVEEVQYGIIKPLENQNPVWSNVHHHYHIIKTAATATNIKDKLKVIFGPPAFVPVNVKATIRDEASEKGADFTLQPEKKLYVFINFIIIAIVGFLGANTLYESGNAVGYFSVLAAVIICFSIFSALLENKKWADYAEVARLAMIGLTGLFFLFNSTQAIIGEVVLSSAVLLLAFTWFIAKRYQRAPIS